MAKNKKTETPALVETWTLPPAATLGSSVRAKGILLEIRARLPSSLRKSLDISGRVFTLTMPESMRNEFRHASAVIAKSLEGIESLPVIPREIEDILTISTTERRRWLEDGRLPSAGTRTVKLRGRARQITFHVFEPRMVEDLLDRGAVEEWREKDTAAATENRRRAAYKAKLTRSLKKDRKTTAASPDLAEEASAKLRGWEEFGRDGLLR
ncbi:hypothetical protein Rleg4DRAFT_6244 [Rhizobium leguminosarum bv. trifolii WSM2297]|uniref:Uncharacterized protein n=1 Tax=Rhizobium leguminosarum bv. trifolii WSM2297 TaxID=754762 RepID=J0CWT5_RHILT|nr:hypothetical protein [Rhizobium leguminosarum]EJC83989.1 hypothetical protein Rleg4DRAFT_5778 [Rhizobium leguminosarum bv. trifolii WSM2297]EJC84420.1 hypothetical protein Rleg4DRAFT_6244 [Rhizobium leguminosarum bv. trifolii WSM2297]